MWEVTVSREEFLTFSVKDNVPDTKSLLNSIHKTDGEAIMSQSKWDEKNLQKSLCKTMMKIGIVRSANRREKQQKQILNRCGQKEWSYELMSKKEADQNSLFFYDVKISMCIFYL